MKKLENSEILKSISKQQTLPISSSYHKTSFSSIIKNPGPKNFSSKLSLNMNLIHSSKLKVAASTGYCSNRNSLGITSKESLIMKEPLKTNKALTKKFDFKQNSQKVEAVRIPRMRWEEQKLPVTPSEVLEKFSDILPL